MTKRKVKKEESDDEELGATPPPPSKTQATRGAKVKKEESDDEADYKAPKPSKRKGRVKKEKPGYTSYSGGHRLGGGDDPAPVEEEDVKPKKAARPSKKAKKEEAEPVEKRLARFRATCPKNITERLQRVRDQRFYMIGRERNGEELREEFKVLGSTGNVYTVVVKNLPTCDCPDYQKGNHCKHLLFIMLKVLCVPTTSGNIYQKALLTPELEEVFRNAPPAPSAAVHNQRVVAAWEKATGSPSKPSTSTSAQLAIEPATGKRNAITEEDTCPICYEDIHGESLDNFLFCEESCGGPIHKECFSNWAGSCRAKGDGKITCVYCRAPWPNMAGGAMKAGGGEATYDGSYLNLADVVGIDSRRDTSTYYHGPVRGMTQRESHAAAVRRYSGYGGY